MKKFVGLGLSLAMMCSLCVPAFAADTQVTYQGNGVEEYLITVPALMAPGDSGEVEVEGTWASNHAVTVKTDDSVVLTNSLDGREKELAVDFFGIYQPGNDFEAVATSENIAIEDLENVIFGTWSGNVTYNVKMETCHLKFGEEYVLYNSAEETDAETMQDITGFGLVQFYSDGDALITIGDGETGIESVLLSELVEEEGMPIRLQYHDNYILVVDSETDEIMGALEVSLDGNKITVDGDEETVFTLNNTTLQPGYYDSGVGGDTPWCDVAIIDEDSVVVGMLTYGTSVEYYDGIEEDYELTIAHKLVNNTIYWSQIGEEPEDPEGSGATVTIGSTTLMGLNLDGMGNIEWTYSENIPLTVIDGDIYSADGKTLIRANYMSDEDYIIHEGVETIGGYAFNSVHGIKNIVIPTTVTYIECNQLFSGNWMIETIYMHGTEEHWSAYEWFNEFVEDTSRDNIELVFIGE